MHLRVITFLLLALVSKLSLAVDIAAHNLVQVHSREDRICQEAAALLSADKACRPADAINCSDEEQYSVLLRGAPRRVFEEIATNEYSYTQIFRSTGRFKQEFEIIYVGEFQGDRHPRLVETWKVDSATLAEVLKLPPGPIPHEQWVKMKPLPPRDTNAAEFAAMLRGAEKISDEWSPVIEIFGEPYVVERECSGTWAYGGYYACNRVIKLTVKKLQAGKKTVPHCQFARQKIK